MFSSCADLKYILKMKYEREEKIYSFQFNCNFWNSNTRTITNCKFFYRRQTRTMSRSIKWVRTFRVVRTPKSLGRKRGALWTLEHICDWSRLIAEDDWHAWRLSPLHQSRDLIDSPRGRKIESNSIETRQLPILDFVSINKRIVWERKREKGTKKTEKERWKKVVDLTYYKNTELKINWR